MTTTIELFARYKALADLCRRGKATDAQWAECDEAECAYLASLPAQASARSVHDLPVASACWSGDARAQRAYCHRCAAREFLSCRC